jgi:hypothetical protein
MLALIRWLAGEGGVGGVGQELERDPSHIWYFEPALNAFRVRVRLTLDKEYLLVQNGLKDLAQGRRCRK